MDWNNVDLNSPYERAQSIITPYSFDTLLLEVSCNLKEITPETVKRQALEILTAKYLDAIDTVETNLTNITNEALKERAIQ